MKFLRTFSKQKNPSWDFLIDENPLRDFSP
jgi:hypothetical protein